MVLGAERGRLGDLALLAGRRVLALGQAVDLVVEEQQLDRHVAAQRVDQVVAADRERVAVAADDPDREVVAGGGDPGRQGQGAAVDAVHPVGVHVVDEAPGAADPGDEDGASRAARPVRASAPGRWRGSRSRRSPGTSASPGRTGSPAWSASAGRCRCRRRWSAVPFSLMTVPPGSRPRAPRRRSAGPRFCCSRSRRPGTCRG